VHQLTIDQAAATVMATAYRSFDEAYRALLGYAIGADYYLWAITRADCHVRYWLMRLANPDDPQPPRRPLIVGAATIEKLPSNECCCSSAALDSQFVPGTTPR
jgi:hypothetical protein